MIDADEIRTVRETARAFLEASKDSSSSLREAADLGWLALSVPESLGGEELGLQVEVAVFEEMGAALYSQPVFTTTALALPALVAAGDEPLVSRVIKGDLRATLAWAETTSTRALAAAGNSALKAEDDGTRVRLSGEKRWVLDGDKADGLVVVARTPAGAALFWVDAAAAQVADIDGIDVSRRMARIVFEASESDLLLSAARTPAALQEIHQRALVLASAEANGLAAQMLAESVEYAVSREQFGRAIGSYQAISHKLADMYVALELSRALVADAAAAVDGQREDIAAAVSAAAAKAVPSAIKTCETAIQIHGGVGMTWESNLHHYYKRALGLGALVGPSWRQRAAYAEIAFA